MKERITPQGCIHACPKCGKKWLHTKYLTCQEFDNALARECKQGEGERVSEGNSNAK